MKIRQLRNFTSLSSTAPPLPPLGSRAGRSRPQRWCRQCSECRSATRGGSSPAHPRPTPGRSDLDSDPSSLSLARSWTQSLALCLHTGQTSSCTGQWSCQHRPSQSWQRGSPPCSARASPPSRHLSPSPPSLPSSSSGSWHMWRVEGLSHGRGQPHGWDLHSGVPWHQWNSSQEFSLFRDHGGGFGDEGNWSVEHQHLPHSSYGRGWVAQIGWLVALVLMLHSFDALQLLSCMWLYWSCCWPGCWAVQGWQPTPAPPIAPSPVFYHPLSASGALDSGAGCIPGEAVLFPEDERDSRRRGTPESHSTFLVSHLVGTELLKVGLSPVGLMPLPPPSTQLHLRSPLQGPIWATVAHHCGRPQRSPPHDCRQLWQTRRVQRRLQDTSSLRWRGFRGLRGCSDPPGSSVAHTSSRHNSRSEQGLQRRAALSLSRHFLALLLCFATCFSLHHCEVSCKKVCCCTIQQAESLPAIKMLPGNEWMCLRIKRLGFQKTCGAV